MTLTDDVDPSWFLAPHLPETWQWPAVALMSALGLGVAGSAAYAYLTYRARLIARSAQAAQPTDGLCERPS